MSRRRTMVVAVAAVAALLATGCTVTSPDPRPSVPAAIADDAPCGGDAGVGSAVPAGFGPGDLVEARELTEAAASSAGFPANGRVWRVLYVTTGVDETDLQLVCGTVGAPVDGPRTDGAPARMLSWAHGTVGVDASCLPSGAPERTFWGAMPGGIGAIGWGSGVGKREGDPADGMLQYALDSGWVVSSADYQPRSTYVVGKAEASAVLDAARATTQLMDDTFGAEAPTSYDTVVVGHSQGGHAALWSGQLAETYLSATAPAHPTAPVRLAGVAALAPASNFITQPGQPGVTAGDGLGDWEMHKNIGLDLPIESLQLQIGPALFSYIFGSWQTLASGPALTPGAAFPAYPPDAAPLALSAVVTDTGARTVDDVMPLCLSGSDSRRVQRAVGGYENAARDRMLVPELWNLPTGYRSGDYFRGGLDQTCGAPPDDGIAAWCTWLRWNLPGPLGVNPYPKAPETESSPVPLLIAQGMNDDIIHCQPADGAPVDDIPDAADCMSRALYDALAADAYCPAGADARGHLELLGVRKAGLDGVDSPATHLSVRGEVAARAISDGSADLVFEGSPLQRFVDGAFSGSLGRGCGMSVIG